MTSIEVWTLWCWFAFWVIWVATWLYQKPVAWQQSDRERSFYSLLFFVATVLALTSFSHHRYSYDPVVLWRMSDIVWLGFFLALGGLVFAVSARFALGSNWSRSMDLKESHELIMTGPYAIVRHPIYAGLLAMFLGTALVVGTIAAILGFVLALWSCIIRVRAEDRLLATQFPTAFPVYASRVKRLLPFVY